MVKLLCITLAVARMSDGCDKPQPVAPTGSSTGSSTGSAVVANDTEPHTTLTPTARAKLDKLMGGAGSGSAIVVATAHPQLSTAPAAKPAPKTAPAAKPAPETAPAAKPAPETAPAAKPAPEKNAWPQLGPHWSYDRMMAVPDAEDGKTSWDYQSVRKAGSSVDTGHIYIAYRCDDDDGCKDSPGGYRWKAIGWWAP
jgi:hypothetical protein